MRFRVKPGMTRVNEMPDQVLNQVQDDVVRNDRRRFPTPEWNYLVDLGS